jgi:hypothetical protein
VDLEQVRQHAVWLETAMPGCTQPETAITVSADDVDANAEVQILPSTIGGVDRRIQFQGQGKTSAVG